MSVFKFLPENWSSHLQSFLSSSTRTDLEKFLDIEYDKKTIYPPKDCVFKALENCSLEETKVVILGQDPYHGEGQAHGLSFSVPKGIKIPPSLRNIFKELQSDIKIEVPDHGDLTSWSKQGVLLLNNVLTVEKSKAGSHQKKGWEEFTAEIINQLSQRENIVFMLWGSPAQKKAKQVCEDKHLVLKSVHPSPLSSYRGFFGCSHFSKANEYLQSHKLKTVDWAVINN